MAIMDKKKHCHNLMTKGYKVVEVIDTTREESKYMVLGKNNELLFEF